MPDLDLTVGGDLTLLAGGNLLTQQGTTLGQQRVLRRLVTTPGDYIWHPSYGAGLPAAVGTIVDVNAITALIRAQILMEAAVSPTPDPVIEVSPIPSGVFVSIRYVDAQTGEPSVLAFNVNR